MYSRFSIFNIIFFIYIINNQINYSYGSDESFFYTYENITDYISKDDTIQYSNRIRIYDKNRTLNKTEVLKLRNQHYLSYYCKNDICVEINYEVFPLYVEIPDEKGNIKGYISKSFSYKDFKHDNYIQIRYNNFFYLECTSDSQCLTNKCINRFCVFNKENPTEYCTDIYINLAMYSYSYMYCGKAIGDICRRNKDCGSKHCSKKKCEYPPPGPCDSCHLTGLLNLIYIGGSIIIISIFIPLFYRFLKLYITIKIEMKRKRKQKNM